MRLASRASTSRGGCFVVLARAWYFSPIGFQRRLYSACASWSEISVPTMSQYPFTLKRSLMIAGLHHELAAVDVQQMAGDELAHVRCEIEAGTGDVLGGPELP